ncbi:MAG: hypothetical protein ACRDH0_10575, partial [Actinomycetota bacterium]
MTKTARVAAMAVAVTMLAGLTLAGSAFAQSPTGEAQKVTWTLGTESDVDSFNPFVAVASGYTIFAMTY